MKVFSGIVTSAKNKNTVSVKVERLLEHPVYKKRIKRTKTFLCHDTTGAQEGDVVLIQETRPLSARKRFIVLSKGTEAGKETAEKKEIR